MTSYDIKAECKGILERVSVTRPVISPADSALQWDSSPGWTAVRQILHDANIDRPGRDSQQPLPPEVTTPRAYDVKTQTVLPVQHLSERTREKLVFMGKTLRVYLPSRVKNAALAKATHIHLLGYKRTGGSKRYKVEIVTAFHPSVAIECDSRFVLYRFFAELPTLAFSFDGGRVANVAVEFLDAKAHDTIFTLGSGPVNENFAIHESLKRFFINDGYVENSDVVSKEENGVIKTYVKARGTRGPAFMQKMSEVLGRVQDWLVPATLADTCSICQPGKKRAQVESQNGAQVEAQSRQELDFNPIGPPEVGLPGQTATPVGLEEPGGTMPQLKRKVSTHDFIREWSKSHKRGNL